MWMQRKSCNSSRSCSKTSHGLQFCPGVRERRDHFGRAKSCAPVFPESPQLCSLPGQFKLTRLFASCAGWGVVDVYLPVPPAEEELSAFLCSEHTARLCATCTC